MPVTYTQVCDADTRYVVWWLGLHGVIITASLIGLGLLIETRPFAASMTLMGLGILGMIELVVLQRCQRQGVVRRIVSRWNPMHSYSLATCLFLMILVWNTLAVLAWRRNFPTLTGLFGGSVSYGMSIIMVILTTPSFVILLLFTRRIKETHQMRADHCTNCGYALETSGLNCPECGYERLVASRIR
jgi:uncharacterized membrane protein